MKTLPSFVAGESVRVRDCVKGPTGHLRKCCGRIGVIELVRKGQVIVRFKPGKDGTLNFKPSELELQR